MFCCVKGKTNQQVRGQRLSRSQRLSRIQIPHSKVTLKLSDDLNFSIQNGQWVGNINKKAFEGNVQNDKKAQQRYQQLNKSVKEKKKQIEVLQQQADKLQAQMELLQEQIWKKRTYNRTISYINLKQEAIIDEYQYKFL